MSSNLEKYRKDIDRLIEDGENLLVAIGVECYPEQVDEAFTKRYGKKAKEVKAALPSFSEAYQPWYSEAHRVIKQLLPDRLADFVRHYEKPKGRKEITYENYRIEDYLQGLTITRGWEKQRVVGPDAAVPQFR